MAGPTKCSVNKNFSLYSNENLGNLKKDFESLSTEVAWNANGAGGSPFKECSKRLEKRKLKLSENKDYKDRRNVYDNAQERGSFFGGLMFQIFTNPAGIDASKDVEDPDGCPLPKKDDIVSISTWKRNGCALEYFNSLLNEYLNEREELKEHYKTDSSESKSHSYSYSSSGDNTNRSSFEANYEEYKKYRGGDVTLDTSGKILWTEFMTQLREVKEQPEGIPPAPLMTGDGLALLFNDLIENVVSMFGTGDGKLLKIYRKLFGGHSVLEFTYKFGNKCIKPLTKFFNNRETYLNDNAELDSNDENNENDDSKGEMTPQQVYRKKKIGYLRVMIHFLDLLSKSVLSDISSIDKIDLEALASEDSGEGNSPARPPKDIFSMLTSTIKGATHEAILITRAWDLERGQDKFELLTKFKPILNNLIDEIANERKGLSNNLAKIRGNEKEGQDADTSSNKGENEFANEIEGVYSFLVDLTDEKTDEKGNPIELGKQFLLRRAQAKLLKEYLEFYELAFKEDVKKGKGNSNLESYKKLMEQDKGYLGKLEEAAEDCDSVGDIVKMLNGEKALLSEFKEEIAECIKDKTIDFNSKIDSLDLKFFNDANAVKSLEPKLKNLKEVLGKDADERKVPNSFTELSDNVKYYFSIGSDKGSNTKGIFTDEINKMRKQIKIASNVDKYNKLNDKAKQIVILRTQLGFLYVFLSANPFDKKFIKPSDQKKYDNTRKENISKLETYLSEDNPDEFIASLTADKKSEDYKDLYDAIKLDGDYNKDFNLNIEKLEKEKKSKNAIEKFKEEALDKKLKAFKELSEKAKNWIDAPNGIESDSPNNFLPDTLQFDTKNMFNGKYGKAKNSDNLTEFKDYAFLSAKDWEEEVEKKKKDIEKFKTDESTKGKWAEKEKRYTEHKDQINKKNKYLAALGIINSNNNVQEEEEVAKFFKSRMELRFFRTCFSENFLGEEISNNQGTDNNKEKDGNTKSSQASSYETLKKSVLSEIDKALSEKFTLDTIIDNVENKTQSVEIINNEDKKVPTDYNIKTYEALINKLKIVNENRDKIVDHLQANQKKLKWMQNNVDEAKEEIKSLGASSEEFRNNYKECFTKFVNKGGNKNVNIKDIINKFDKDELEYNYMSFDDDDFNKEQNKIKLFMEIKRGKVMSDKEREEILKRGVKQGT